MAEGSTEGGALLAYACVGLGSRSNFAWGVRLALVVLIVVRLLFMIARARGHS